MTYLPDASADFAQALSILGSGSGGTPTERLLRGWRGGGRRGRCGRCGARTGTAIEAEAQGRRKVGHFSENVRADIFRGELRRATLVNEHRKHVNNRHGRGDGRGLRDRRGLRNGRSFGRKIEFEDGGAA